MELSVIQLSPAQLNELMTNAAVLGAHTALRYAGVPIKEYYTRAELSRKFGRGKIDRMISKSLLTPHKMDDGRQVYLLSEVEAHIL